MNTSKDEGVLVDMAEKGRKKKKNAKAPAAIAESSAAQTEPDDFEDEEIQQQKSPGRAKSKESHNVKGDKLRTLSGQGLNKRTKSSVQQAEEPKKDEQKRDDQQPGLKKIENKTKRIFWITRSIAEGIDRTLFLRCTLIDIVIYGVFAFSVLVHGSYLRDIGVYQMHNAVRRHFLDQEFTSSSGRRISYDAVASAADVWSYLRFFAYMLSTEYLYDQTGEHIREAKGEERKVLMQNYVLGVARLRQLRVRNDSCQVHPLLRNIFRTCYSIYTEEKKNKLAFGPANGTAWTYHTEKETGSLPFYSVIGRLGGDGFYQDLSVNRNETLRIIDELENNFWITRETRAIFIDFSLYNVNLNTFCVCKIGFLFPHIGGVVPDGSLVAAVLLPRVIWELIYEGTFSAIMVIIAVYYCAEMIREALYFRWRYVRQFWTFMDGGIVSLTATLTYLWFMHLNFGGEILKNVRENPNKYGNMEVPVSWYSTYKNLNALQLYLVYMKAFKYLNFNKTMGQLNNTLKKCRWDTFSFSIMYFIVFFAFAELGYLLFGERTETFKDFPTAMFTLLCTILGDFDYEELQKANRVMAPIFFICFIFFIFFVLINMFVAIINDAYGDVKTENTLATDELQMSEYIKTGITSLFSKCKARQSTPKWQKRKAMTVEQIYDILSQCGFTDEEIEGFLLKYLSVARDGDRIEVVLQKLEVELDQQEVSMGQMFQFIKPKDYFAHQEKIEQIDNSIEECTKRLEKLLFKLSRLGNVKKTRRTT